ncbi:MAG: aminoacyl-tRNA hydrolase [Desulfomonilaceae bacterium]|nr:aminoacyl-tRNA hydrolase [Desulfomonilaceae bacterium]
MQGRSTGKQIVIVGLGNPGRAYSLHRHNAGFHVVDELAAQENGSWSRNREKTIICGIEIESQRVILAKPQTYMNLSGKAVAPLLQRENADPSRLVVVHDDLDIALGRIRIKVGGGDGGHKGIRSIADSLRFRDFIRVRLGIGRPPEGVPAEEFVLTVFSPDEQPTARALITAGAQAVRLIVASGVEEARNTVHSGRLTQESAK